MFRETVNGRVIMPEEKDKWVDAVAKIIKLTHEDRIKWNSADPPDNLRGGPDRYVDIVFLAKHKDTYLRLYQRHSKVEEPMPNIGMLLGKKYPYWTYRTVLEIIDDNGNPLWEFPQVSPLNDLLTSVKYQVSGVKGFIDDILAE
jgi:hypothetical protein